MTPKEIISKSILVKSNLPDTDYVVNPYTGCRFACLYCYASFMGRFVNQPITQWGNYVYVKTNAVSLFEKEISRLERKAVPPSILLSSVTDPYQGIENRYKITHGILKHISQIKYQGAVSILTKSPLVLRDIAILKKIPNLEVGMTITTSTDNISRFLEVHAPAASKRINALTRLNNEGISTYAFIGPILPHYYRKPEALENVVKAIKNAGTSEVYIEHINLSNHVKQRLRPLLAEQEKDIGDTYHLHKDKAFKAKMDKMIIKIIESNQCQLRLGSPIHHK